jgi:hypothetical protein
MKRIRIVQTAAFVLVAALLVSCGPSREYDRGYGSYPPPPPPRSSVSLIIHAGPGMVVNRYPDGRYYYRAPNGYTYWRGYGNRYYLDRRYMNRGYYSHRQYNDWRRYYRRR